ncbi:MAG: alpha-glucuronidase [Oscillospiraceae bacterium]|nr:alpha-glucuronidase [Oscillospiraceae bacterium]
MDMLYDCWLAYGKDDSMKWTEKYLSRLCVLCSGRVISSAVKELEAAFGRLTGNIPERISQPLSEGCFILRINDSLGAGGYDISVSDESITVMGGDENGVLYGVFRFLILASGGYPPESLSITEKPCFPLRMIDQWDNADGTVERGYSGASIFFEKGRPVSDMKRLTDYARLLSSVGINAICINNVNVHRTETFFITEGLLPDIAKIAGIFADYGIKLYLSVNFAAPMEIDGLSTADPLDERVKSRWKCTADNIYRHIPEFGGFLVKADSENRPGPHTYGRDHAEGANMLAAALKPFGGNVIWRCFVYNCHVDWRDRTTDRAKAAYDNFKPLDGKFADNVYLQIKNGPMDFQIREAVSPLFGAMPDTNCLCEFQITQEYTGQQIDLCYLVPMWKECLDFDTYHGGEGSLVSRNILGAAGVSNVGSDRCWTGDPLAGANLYGYGRLVFDPALSAEKIAMEWVRAAITADEETAEVICKMLVSSRDIYESYTSPLGVGWMVTPHYHYGVDVDGYEYSPWGTYHYSDRNGMGADRTKATGTGYTAQYAPHNEEMYENVSACPEELLLFFHHLPYTYMLSSGKTLIQHIYDSHFEGAEKAEELLMRWRSLKERVPEEYYREAELRFEKQIENSRQWRDVINTYYYRKSGIDDIRGRKIFR